MNIKTIAIIASAISLAGAAAHAGHCGGAWRR